MTSELRLLSRGVLKRTTKLRVRLGNRIRRARGSGEMAYRCYVISLARLPWKYPGFLARNGATGLDFKRFDGVDGKTLTLAEAIDMRVISPDATGYTQGMIGCAASHLQLWKQARDSGENILIFYNQSINLFLKNLD